MGNLYRYRHFLAVHRCVNFKRRYCVIVRTFYGFRAQVDLACAAIDKQYHFGNNGEGNRLRHRRARVATPRTCYRNRRRTRLQGLEYAVFVYRTYGRIAYFVRKRYVIVRLFVEDNFTRQYPFRGLVRRDFFFGNVRQRQRRQQIAHRYFYHAGVARLAVGYGDSCRTYAQRLDSAVLVNRYYGRIRRRETKRCAVRLIIGRRQRRFFAQHQGHGLACKFYRVRRSGRAFGRRLTAAYRKCRRRHEKDACQYN